MKYARLFLVVALCLAFSGNALALSCPVGCDECPGPDACAACAFCTAVTATARPPALPEATRPLQTPLPAPAATKRPAATRTPAVSNGDYTTISVAKQEEIVFELLNLDRARNGLPPLVLDAELSRIARIKSQDMKDNHYFAHESPTYGRAPQMLAHFGYPFNGAGENIAHHATVEKAQAAFLSSPAHRINLMGKQWQKVGIGVVYDDQGFVYVTQLFVR